MPGERHVIEPITTSRRLRFLEDAQLDALREASLDILENVGVRFDSEKALVIFAEHGANVDRSSQIVKLPRDLVLKAMANVPRRFTFVARDPDLDLPIDSITEAGLREKVKVMIGGAPVTQDFANEIGADGYADDAIAAVNVARKLVGAAA